MRVGLVGAGTWARRMHAPMLAHGPGDRAERRVGASFPAAADLAAVMGVVSVASFDELLDSCEAVDFAVPPDVQAELAPLAVARGKAVMLEKPIGRDLLSAQVLAEAVHATGVASIVVLTKRFHPRTRAFLADVESLRAARATVGPRRPLPARRSARRGLRARLAAGRRCARRSRAAPARPGRRGAGSDRRLPRSRRSRRTYLTLTCEHESGAISQLALSGKVEGSSSVTRIDVAGRAGTLTWDTVGMDHDECRPVLRAEFASAVRRGYSGDG